MGIAIFFKVICFFAYIFAAFIGGLKIFGIIEKNQDNEGLSIFVGCMLIIYLVLVIGFGFMLNGLLVG